jgi:hypothetical protein
MPQACQKRPCRNWELGLLFVGHFIVTVDHAQATTVEVDLRHVHVRGLLERRTMKRGLDDQHCSFCGKRKDGVLQIVRGPNVCICDECVKLCVGIITKLHPEWRGRLDSPSVQDDKN